MEETTLLKLDKVDICREENVILHRASFTLHNGEFVYVIGKVGSFSFKSPTGILVFCSTMAKLC